MSTVDASRIGEEAERAVLSLPVARGKGFESLYSYLVVDEPVVHLMPLHFCPGWARGSVNAESLHALGVAAKLEYARSRWVDEIVDAGSVASLSSIHRLHDALLELINTRYVKILGDKVCRFLPTLANLHARHAMSLALDGSCLRDFGLRVSFEDYVEHARTRHGPYRAPIDAVLVLAGASEDLLQDARTSWHSWALGVQLYDDAVDIEEDYKNRNQSWTVSRTLEDIGRSAVIASPPDADAFYEAALSKRAIFDTLRRAESFFRESALASGCRFPSWVGIQQACLDQTRKLREDLQALASEFGSYDVG